MKRISPRDLPKVKGIKMGHKWARQVAGRNSWLESLVARHNGVDLRFMVDTYDAQPNPVATMWMVRHSPPMR